MHECSYLVTFKTRGKSNIGLSCFERQIGGIIEAFGRVKKGESTSMVRLGRKPEEISDILKKNNVDFLELRTSDAQFVEEQKNVRK